LSTKRLRLTLLTHQGLDHNARAQATGAHGKSPHTAVRKLVTHTLEVGVKTTLGLDIGMADEVANLGLFAAENAFLAHTILRICKKTVHFTCGKNKAQRRKMYSV
jgi:hypothetical protein